MKHSLHYINQGKVPALSTLYALHAWQCMAMRGAKPAVQFVKTQQLRDRSTPDSCRMAGPAWNTPMCFPMNLSPINQSTMCFPNQPCASQSTKCFPINLIPINIKTKQLYFFPTPDSPDTPVGWQSQHGALHVLPNPFDLDVTPIQFASK